MFEVRITKDIPKNFKVICDGRTKFFESMDSIIEWVFSDECPDPEHFRIEKMN